MKKMNIIIISLTLLGSILIIYATYISTVKISIIDNNINLVEEEINRLNDKIERGIIFGLNYRQNEIKKRLNYLELNNLTLHNAEIKLQDELKNRILNENVDLIKAWSNLWKLDESITDIDRINKELNIIIEGKTNFEYKKDKLENLLNYSFEIANNNLQKLQKERNIKNANKNNLEKIRLSKFNLFKWLQISGLILLGISSILEKVLIK